MGVRNTDHHTESRLFLTHLEREERAGRSTPADWSWIVPPMSGGLTKVFHRYYDEADQRPNFYLDEGAKNLGRCPVAHGPAAAVTPVVLRDPAPIPHQRAEEPPAGEPDGAVAESARRGWLRRR